MSRPKKREQDALFDPELAELPEGARWREWMGRVEAAIFAARDPVPREALAKLVGPRCKLDDLIADIVDELRARPYDLVFVAGGYQLRTKPRFSAAIRAANAGELRDAGASRTDADRTSGGDGDRLSATRDPRGNLAARRQGNQPRRHRPPEASRSHRRGLARARTRRALRLCHDEKFLEVFGLATLRDLPDIERLEDEGLLQRPQSDIDLDGALGLVEDDGQIFERELEFEGAELEDTTDDA